MCPDDNIENTNAKNKTKICETSTLTNSSNVENAYLMTMKIKVKNKNIEQMVQWILVLKTVMLAKRWLRFCIWFQ